MIKDAARNIRIFISQGKRLSISDTLLLFIKSLFKREQISIYVKELDASMNSLRLYSLLDNSIIKGKMDEIEQARKSIHPPAWEFCCDLYDGVKDYFIYRDNGVIGHVSWIYYKDDPNRIIELNDDEGEIKYSLTLPQFRGKGIYPATLVKIQRHLKEHGYKRVFICVKEDNIPSIKGIEKAGFNFVTSINLTKIMGIQLNKRYDNGCREKNN